MLQQEFNFRSLMVKDEAGTYRLATGAEIIEAAMREINARFSRGAVITSPAATQEYLRLKLAHRGTKFSPCSGWTTATGFLPLRSCFGGPSTGPVFTLGKW